MYNFIILNVFFCSSLFRSTIPLLLVVVVVCSVNAASPNHALFSRFGLARWEGPDKPQLFTSRRIGESSVYYIKLPPSQYYYTPFQQDPTVPTPYLQPLPVNFISNGKPNHIYHWNIPFLTKMAARAQARKKLVNTSSVGGPSKPSKVKVTPNDYSNSRIYNISKQKPLKTLPRKNTDTERNQLIKQYRTPNVNSPFNRVFPGNGKPQSLYVINELEKPVFYQRLLP